MGGPLGGGPLSVALAVGVRNGDPDGDAEGDAEGDLDGGAEGGLDGDAEGDRDEDTDGNPDGDTAADDGGAAAAELGRDALADVAGALAAVALAVKGCVTALLSVGPEARGAVSNRHAVIAPASSRTTATATAEMARPGRRQRPAAVRAATGAVIGTPPRSRRPGPR